MKNDMEICTGLNTHEPICFVCRDCPLCQSIKELEYTLELLKKAEQENG